LEAALDTHKPHAAKRWPEFLIELATIIAGILIALALEQAVEAAHDRRRAAEARENIRAEIAGNLGAIQARAATEPCVSRRLDEAQGLIQSSSAGKTDPGPIWIGHPLLLAMLDSRYRSASEGGDIKLLPAKEQEQYAAAYSSFRTFADAELREQAAWSDLRALEQNPPSAPAAEWALRSALQRARTERWILEITALAARPIAAALAIEPAGAEVYRLASVCVPLRTPRAEALKLVVAGRPSHLVYDEP
jgi:hypothetical protein